MFEIHEVSAAPHFPEPLKITTSAARPESVLALVAMAPENDNVEISMRDGEIFVALTAS